MKPRREPMPGVGRYPMKSLVRRVGFTLLEVLIAIAIFAGVLAAIYSSWACILRGSHTALAAAAEVQRSRVAVRSLQEALIAAQFFQANAHYYSFVAETSDEFASLSFVARLPDDFPRSGRFADRPMRRVTFTVEPDGTGGNALMLRQQPFLSDVDVDEKDNPLVLARNLLLFHLEFWGANSREWEPEWLLTNQLPRLVRFSLATQASDGYGVARSQVISHVVVLPAGSQPGQRPGFPTSGPNTGAPPGRTPSDLQTLPPDRDRRRAGNPRTP